MSKSLLKYHPEHTLFIVCMDSEVYKSLVRNPIPNSLIFPHQELLKFCPQLIEIRKQRSNAEYFFTCSAQVCEFIISKNLSIDILNYIDADLCFYNSLNPLFEELGNASIGIIKHNFHFLNRSKVKYGKYNVGWISFRNDIEGRKCISTWAKDCIEWCYQRLENGKYADQKYLDYWPDKYPNLKILIHKGANLAIWNLKNYNIKLYNGKIFVDNDPLLFYHFAGLKQIQSNKFITHLSSYYVKLQGVVLEKIYIPYLKDIVKLKSKKKIEFKKEMNRPNLVSLLRSFFIQVRIYLFKDLIEI